MFFGEKIYFFSSGLICFFFFIFLDALPSSEDFKVLVRGICTFINDCFTV